MLAIARALMTEPTLILLDEPTAGLAPQVVDEVFAGCGGLAEAGVAVLMVEQNAKAALRVSDRGYVLAEGRNRIAGSGCRPADRSGRRRGLSRRPRRARGMIGQAIADGILTGAIIALGAIGVSLHAADHALRQLRARRAADLGRLPRARLRRVRRTPARRPGRFRFGWQLLAAAALAAAADRAARWARRPSRVPALRRRGAHRSRWCSRRSARRSSCAT